MSFTGVILKNIRKSRCTIGVNDTVGHIMGLTYFVFCRLYPFSPLATTETEEPKFYNFKEHRNRSKELILSADVAWKACTTFVVPARKEIDS
jgi:hypothetical protein